MRNDSKWLDEILTSFKRYCEDIGGGEYITVKGKRLSYDKAKQQIKENIQKEKMEYAKEVIGPNYRKCTIPGLPYMKQYGATMVGASKEQAVGINYELGWQRKLNRQLGGK